MKKRGRERERRKKKSLLGAFHHLEESGCVRRVTFNWRATGCSQEERRGGGGEERRGEEEEEGRGGSLGGAEWAEPASQPAVTHSGRSFNW